jgi:hypothetical protein
LIAGLKDPMEYWPRITAEEQRVALDEFLSRTADNSSGNNSPSSSGGDDESINDLE